MSIVYESFKEDDIYVNSALIRGIYREVLVSNPDLSLLQVGECAISILRSDFGYPMFSKEDSERKDVRRWAKGKVNIKI